MFLASSLLAAAASLDVPSRSVHISTAGAWNGQTSVTQSLNKMIAGTPGTYDPKKTYTGGTGIFVRNPYDGYENGGPHKGVGGAYEVLPSTFISNDIFASNKVFPRFVGNMFDWKSCPVVYVVGSAMANMLYDFDNIQKSTWGWGVFYPWDANAVDFRCEWLDLKGTPQLYDCPGYSKKFSDKTPTKDANMFGAGYFKAGNPYANEQWGGGAGCHFSGAPFGCNDPSKCTNDIDQVNRNADGWQRNLVRDQTCQCNYLYNDNWGHWVAQLNNLTAEAAKGTLPEAAMCWTNNLRDMINLANNLFWSRVQWFTHGELGDHGPSGYWGWNEIPLTRTGTGGITNPQNWDAVAIKMPLYACGGQGGDDHLGCLTTAAATNLETDLSQWVKDGMLVPGASNIGKRPGSYIVLMREWPDKDGNSYSFFFL